MSKGFVKKLVWKQIYLLPTSVTNFTWDVTDIFVILSKHPFTHILLQVITYLTWTPEKLNNQSFPLTKAIIIIIYICNMLTRETFQLQKQHMLTILLLYASPIIYHQPPQPPTWLAYDYYSTYIKPQSFTKLKLKSNHNQQHTETKTKRFTD